MAKVTKINELSGQIDTLTLGLASRVQKDFNLAKNIRILQDECHVQNIRDYIGQYAPDVKFRDGQSKVFVKLCRTKVAAAQARLIALAFPPTGFPWSLKPSPEPELYGEEHVQTPAGEIADKGVPGKEDSDEHEQLELHIARVKADRMRRKIHYALVCGDWETTEASGILDLVLHGTMIFRGPLKKCKEGVKYQFVEESGLKATLKRLFRKPVGGKWEGKVEKEYYPGSDWISVFDFYPEPMSKDANDMQWGIVRHVMDRSQVIGLKEIDGFDAEEIDIALRNNPKGNWVAQPWESQINVLHNKSGSMNLGERFEVLEWRGKLTGRDIRMAGGNISDDKLNMSGYGCIWAIGNHAISMSISEAVPTRLPFYIVPYERVPYKIWGQGIAEMMRDSQAIINAATRAMVDNMGMACLTGDTVVYRHERKSSKKQRKYGSKKDVAITINQLWEQKHNNGTRGSGLRRNLIRCLDESTGEFYGNRIVDLFDNGIRPVFEVKTLRGYTIKATSNHRFMAEDGGYRELSEFSEGSLIAVNGTSIALDHECLDCGVQLSANPTAIRCKSCAAKVSTWNVKQAIDAMSNGNASGTTARARKLVRIQMRDECEDCGTNSRLHIHHVDGNPFNGDASNLMTMCEPCHKKWHARHDNFGDALMHTYVDYDAIVSITPAGEERVFDLQMAAPDHNFVANGFVSHNSGPQIVADLSRLANPNDVNKVAPWKVWAVKNMDGITGDPVKFQVVPSIIGDLEKVQNIFRAFAQEETSMPDMLHGGVGPGGSGVRTIGQTQMLFGAADTFTKSVYFNIDNYLTKPMIRDYYNWYMQNHDDDSIKGDMVVEVGGMLGAIEKELRAQTLSEIMQYTQEGSPFAIAMNKSEIISELLRSRDLVNEAFVYPEEVVERKIQEQQQMQQQQEIQMQQMQGAMQQQAAKLQQDAMMEKQDAEHRFKAETTKNDTLLNVFDKTPPNSPVYPELMAMTLEANGMLDEDARVAINVMRRVVASTYGAYMTDQEKEIMTGGGPAPKPPEPAPEDNPKTAVKPGMGASAGNENPLLPKDMSTYSLPTVPPGGPAVPKGAQEAKRQIIPVMDGNGRVVGSRVE